MILKDIDEKNEIEGYLIIKQYKYLGITIDNLMKFNLFFFYFFFSF